MHGDMAQEKRSAVVEDLLDGRYSVVVATNVLGRGVDLSNVRQVHVQCTCTCVGGYALSLKLSSPLLVSSLFSPPPPPPLLSTIMYVAESR